MGMLDVMKGAYLTDSGLDKTLPVKAGDVVTRGSILVIDATSGEFRLCDADDANDAEGAALIPYVALVPTDRVAGFAGSRGPGMSPNAGSAGYPGFTAATLGVVRSGSNIAAGQYLVTAIPLNAPYELRCSEFTAGTYLPGALLTFGEGGKLAALGTDDGTKTVIGKVTVGTSAASPNMYYQNDKQVTSEMQGGATECIEFVTCWQPPVRS